MKDEVSREIKHSVYLLQCNDGSLYTGYATDVARRLSEHNGAEKTAGAKYTRGRRPVRLVYTECFDSRSEALKREAAIKKLSRTEKLILIKNNSHPADV